MTVELVATGCCVCRNLLQVQSKKLRLAQEVPELKMVEGWKNIRRKQNICLLFYCNLPLF